MNQLGFDALPALDSHIDFAAPCADAGRIADLDVVRRLHRRQFVPMDANSTAPGKVMRYVILPPELGPAEVSPAHQGMAAAPEPKMVSAAQAQARIREAKAVNALTLDGQNVVRPY